MSDRGRELPAWMSKKEKEKERVKGPLKTTRKPKVARSAFYCMNEKEFVEAAVSFLTNCTRDDLRGEHQSGPRAAEATAAATESPSSRTRTSHTVAEAWSWESPDSSEAEDQDQAQNQAQDQSYVSESDLDLTEAETVPYADNRKPEDDRDTEAEDDRGRDVNKHDVSQSPSEAGGNDDDDFQLVREIFFT